MFTGIIESIGRIVSVEDIGSGRKFGIASSLAPELRVDQSLSHNGACLTVESVTPDHYEVTAILETLRKTTLGQWANGDQVNLERCLRPDGRLDGHIVQGHVDTTGRCEERTELNGSWEFRISFPESFAHLVIEKGSICLNGISLTVFAVERSSFRVAIIPYTYHHTTLQLLQPADPVNLEFDLVGKYIARFRQLQSE